MKQHQRLRIFIGSSSEGKLIAEHLQWALNDTCDAVVWDQGVVEPGHTTFRALHDAVARFDFAVFILTPDDILDKRGHVSAAPRDNVVLELGLFTGVLGPERTFIVQPHGVELTLPSDLAGVTAVRSHSREDGNYRAMLKPVALELHEAMTRVVERALVKASAEADRAIAERCSELRTTQDESGRDYLRLAGSLRKLESRVGAPGATARHTLQSLLAEIEDLDLRFVHDVGVGLRAIETLQGRPLDVTIDFAEIYRYIRWPFTADRPAGTRWRYSGRGGRCTCSRARPLNCPHTSPARAPSGTTRRRCAGECLRQKARCPSSRASTIPFAV